MLDNVWRILSAPDNIAVAGMLVLVLFFCGVVVVLARRNDRLRAAAPPPDAAALAEAERQGVVLGVDVVYPEAEQGLPRKVLTWPHLVRIEFLAAIFLSVLLLVWSLLVDAPLEEPANPGLSPNPAKAPWYFLGLQELLVYFDPWIAGVVLPGIIIVGLMAIPYLDVNPRGSGYYTLRERRFAMGVFFFGFVVLWVFFIIIGTFLRGPGWMWFWPWEPWDAQRVVSETNINLNDFLGGLLGLEALKSRAGAFWLGLVILGAYYGLGLGVPYWLLKRRRSPTLARLGVFRYGAVALLFWSMVGLPVKVLLRLCIHVKYVWVTPWFHV